MIRTAEPKDAWGVWEAIVQALGYTCEQATVERRITALSGDPHCISLVYEDDVSGQVVGFVHALRYDTLHSEGGWDVVSLAVVPAWQSRGIGRKLLEALEERVLAGGGSYVRLNSRVERTEAHGFYEHLGYMCDKTQKRFIKRLA